jgi:WD40 repeat protein
MAVCFSPDGKRLASGGGDYTVRIWDMASGKALKTMKGHTENAEAVCFSPDGKILVSGSRFSDKTLRVWDPATGKSLKTLTGHTGAAKSFNFTPDGKLLVSAHWDGTVMFYDCRHFKPVGLLILGKNGNWLTVDKYNRVRRRDDGTLLVDTDANGRRIPFR